MIASRDPYINSDVPSREPASQKPLDFIKDSDKLKGKIKVSSVDGAKIKEGRNKNIADSSEMQQRIQNNAQTTIQLIEDNSS